MHSAVFSIFACILDYDGKLSIVLMYALLGAYTHLIGAMVL